MRNRNVTIASIECVKKANSAGRPTPVLQIIIMQNQIRTTQLCQYVLEKWNPLVGAWCRGYYSLRHVRYGLYMTTAVVAMPLAHERRVSTIAYAKHRSGWGEKWRNAGAFQNQRKPYLSFYLPFNQQQEKKLQLKMASCDDDLIAAHLERPVLLGTI